MSYFVEVQVVTVKEFEVDDVDSPQEALKKVYNRLDDNDFIVTEIEEYDMVTGMSVCDGYGKKWSPEEIQKWIYEFSHSSSPSMDTL